MPRLTDYGRVLNSGGKTFLFLSLTLFVCLFVCQLSASEKPKSLAGVFRSEWK